MRTCRDCAVTEGQPHVGGCCIERCARCGGQAISCNCVYELNNIDVPTMETAHPEIYSKGPTKEMWAVFEDAVPGLVLFGQEPRPPGCTDCEKTFYEMPYYMLHHRVWRQALEDKPARMLCFACLTQRLGRKLTMQDFNSAPINTLFFEAGHPEINTYVETA